MPATYEPIATTTLGSAASTITFSSITSSYTDLRLVLVCRTTTANNAPLIRFNSDTGSNYSGTFIYGDGATATSSRSTSATFISPGDVRSDQWVFIATDIFSYAGSTNKTVLTENSGDRNGSGLVYRFCSLWRNTAAINAISITAPSSDTFITGTTATLYGIKSF